MSLATRAAKTPGDHSARVGRITRISGPVVSAVGLPDAHILDVVRVGQAIFGARPTGDAFYWPGFAPDSDATRIG